MSWFRTRSVIFHFHRLPSLPKVQYAYKSIAVSLSPLKYELMPIRPVKVSSLKKSLNLEALIDSGANRCFCPIEVGEALAIPFSACPKQSVRGIGGAGDVYIHEVTIDVEHGSYTVKAEVGFGQFEFHGFSMILGQQGFFESIDILFRRRKKQVEIFTP